MKKFVLFIITLVFALNAFVLSGCDNNTGVKDPDNSQPKEEELYSEGLHQSEIDFSNNVARFVTEEKTDYKIAVMDDTYAGKASKFVQSQIAAATGANITVEDNLDEDNINDTSKYIVFGANLSKFNLDLAEDVKSTLKRAGYRIQTYNQNVLINAYSARGYQLAALAFLRAVVGYDMFSEDVIVYEKDGSVMPKMDITEKPDYDYIMAPNKMSNNAQYGFGYTSLNEIFAFTEQTFNYGGESVKERNWIHNCLSFVDEEDKVGEYKDKWFSADGFQLCYTAHGDKVAYDALVEKVSEKALEWYRYNDSITVMAITQLDVTSKRPQIKDACECTTCEAAKAYYKSNGGANLMFINDVSKKVNAYLSSEEGIEEFGGERNLSIAMLAYRANLTPPIDDQDKNLTKIECRFDADGNKIELKFDENGNEVSEGGSTRRLQCVDNVMLMYAASQADYTVPFNHSYNSDFVSQLEGWSKLGGELFIWGYEAYFNKYIYPYNSWETTYKSTRYFKEIGSSTIYWEGTYENGNFTGFSKLKDYLESKIGFDVNANNKYYTERFFKNFYGDGGEFMYKYFLELKVWMTDYVDIDIDMHKGRQHNAPIDDKKYWPYQTLKQWLDYTKQAEAAIEPLKIRNPELYEVYKKNILMETIFPRYALIELYTDRFTDAELMQERSDFKRDFIDVLNNTTHQEHFTFVGNKLPEWNLG